MLVAFRCTLVILFLFILSYVMELFGDDEMDWFWKHTFEDFP